MQRVYLKVGKIIAIIAMFFLAAFPASAQNPVGDFFKRLGNSIAHPGQKPPVRKSTKKNGSKTAAGTSPAPLTSPSPGQPETVVQPQPTPVMQSTPTPQPVRAAGGLPRPTRRDMPYGVPVPNRPGFVTSPYAPTVGLVDVRGFPSGTEVKDPYTGKIFLTP